MNIRESFSHALEQGTVVEYLQFLLMRCLPVYHTPKVPTLLHPGSHFFPFEAAAGMGSNRVTVKKFLQLLTIFELYLELSYFLSQIFKMVTVTEVTKVPKFRI